MPRVEGTVILAFDVSGSMAATDLAPTRMEAAKAAARAFVERQPATVRIGVVAFSDSGFSIQVPTDDPVQVTAAIDRLAPERGTADRPRHRHRPDHDRHGRGRARSGLLHEPARPARRPRPSPLPAGTYESAVIVLLTDGENNQTPDPLEAAAAAAERKVRIFTVGIGTAAGSTLEIEGFRVHSQLDEAVLRQIAGRDRRRRTSRPPIRRR